MTDRLVHNRHLVDDLGGALRSGQHGLAVVPGLLKRVLEEESWREFTTVRGELVRHERFVEFVVAPPLAGIGATVELLKRLVKDDSEALDLLDRALQQPNHRPESRDDITSYKDPNARGTSKEYALRKLRKDAPELHADVLAGRLSAHSAMVQAGFRPRTFTVRADDSQSVARSLRKYLTEDQIAELARLLAADA